MYTTIYAKPLDCWNNPSLVQWTTYRSYSLCLYLHWLSTKRWGRSFSYSSRSCDRGFKEVPTHRVGPGQGGTSDHDLVVGPVRYLQLIKWHVSWQSRLVILTPRGQHRSCQKSSDEWSRRELSWPLFGFRNEDTRQVVNHRLLRCSLILLCK